MKQAKLFIAVLFIGFLQVNYAQNIPSKDDISNVYEDRITDEFGNPLSGIKVTVSNKGIHTYSDFNGQFSIKASNGDKIVLTKDGEKIGSYRLNGSLDYQVDATHVFGKEEKKIAKKKSRYSRVQKISFLDSASFYLHKDSYKSIDFVTRHLDATKSSDKELTRSHELLGDNYMRLSQYDLAISSYQTALKTSTAIALQLKLADALFQNKQYAASSDLYQELQELSLSNWQSVLTNEGLGKNYEKLNQPNKAIVYYKKALVIAKEHQITPKISNLNTQIAKLLASDGQQLEANVRLEETLQEAELEHVNKRMQVQNTIANIYQTNQDFDSEIELRKQTLEEFEDVTEESVVVKDAVEETVLSKPQLNFEIGRAYVDKNEFKKAIPYLEKSVSEAVEVNNLEVQKNAIQKLSELYKRTGNSKKALQKYQEYASVVDLLYQQREEEIQATVSLSKELQNKQNRINSLEKDRELSVSQLQLSERDQELKTSNFKRQKLLIYGLLVGLLLFAIALYYMYRSNKQRKLANNLLALKSLRSQMNPHFIFNALNSVNSFIAQSDERAANRYLTDFSKLMRSVLNNSEEDFIPLEKEIELLQLYIKLEHSRFEDKFDYEINVADNVAVTSFQIPPMLLQPYVENAVWHGLRYKKTKGKLQIDIVQKDPETITIIISDNGIGRKKSKALKTQNQKKQQSKGMGNIKKRVKILNEMYADKVDVFINDLETDGSGTRVELVLKRD